MCLFVLGIFWTGVVHFIGEMVWVFKDFGKGIPQQEVIFPAFKLSTRKVIYEKTNIKAKGTLKLVTFSFSNAGAAR